MRHNMLIRIDIQIHQPQERLDNGGFAITSSSNYLDPLASGEARLTEAELELADGWIQIHQPQERLDFRNSSHIHTLSNLDPLASGEARRKAAKERKRSVNIQIHQPQERLDCRDAFRKLSVYGIQIHQPQERLDTGKCYYSNSYNHLDPLASGEARHYRIRR